MEKFVSLFKYAASDYCLGIKLVFPSQGTLIRASLGAKLTENLWLTRWGIPQVFRFFRVTKKKTTVRDGSSTSKLQVLQS